MRIILLGPPGAGKGTQAAFIAQHFAIPHISTGEIFRANVAGETELGLEAKRYMDKGELVPDGVTNAMVRDRLAEDDAVDGFLLDGFPRTLPQAEALDGILDELGTPLTAVVEFQADEEEVVRRLTGRRVCGQCGRAWHVEFEPPSRAGVCDECGGELAQRDDDKPETIRRRMKVYEEQTSPLVDHYAKAGLVVAVDAMGPVDGVTQRAIDALTT